MRRNFFLRAVSSGFSGVSLKVAASVGFAALSVACSSSSPMTEDAGEVPDSGAAAETGAAGNPCGDVRQTIFTPVCGTMAGCHTPTGSANGLDLASTGLPNRLIDKAAFGGPGKLIDSQNPGQSVLYLKVTPNFPFGVRMPFAQPPLSDTQIQCIKEFVFSAVGADAGQ